MSPPLVAGVRRSVAVLPGRAQDGELVGDLEAPAAEPEERRRTAAGAARRAPLAGRLEQAAPQQHPLEVRRRDLVPERGRVELPKLGDRERLRREGEAEV